MRRRLAIVVLLATALACSVASTPVSAQTDGDTTVTTIGAEDSPGIIPEPDSGAEPQDAGDRGGALQTVLFVVLIAGMLTIGALAVRQSRRARAGRGF